ncbi:TPA: hypothetical protein QDB44_004206 [Burkholderia vietnamiensis]|nr:hypothetical protein [Burkholderia vietnamiensis]
MGAILEKRQALAALLGHTNVLVTMRYLEMCLYGCRQNEVTSLSIPKDVSGSKPQAHGVLRDWHDLDRTDALTAHLAALDKQLRS